MKNTIKLLIIEDISNNIDSIRNGLSDFGSFERKNIFPHVDQQQEFIQEVIKNAKDSKSLYEYIVDKIEQFSIKALIIDLNLVPGDMPDDIMQSQGMQLIKDLKDNPLICDIPIVVLSVREDLNEVPMTLIARGVVVLKKPTAVDPDAVSRLFTKDIDDFLVKKCKSQR